MEKIINKVRDLLWSLEGNSVLDENNDICVTLSLSKKGIENFQNSIAEEYINLAIQANMKYELKDIREYRIPLVGTIKLEHNGK